MKLRLACASLVDVVHALPQVVQTSSSPTQHEPSRRWPPLQKSLLASVESGCICAGLFEVGSMVEALTRLLQTLHGADRVHRDLKPDNVIWLLTRAQWRLLDLGICARAGAPLRACPARPCPLSSCMYACGAHTMPALASQACPRLQVKLLMFVLEPCAQQQAVRER